MARSNIDPVIHPLATFKGQPLTVSTAWAIGSIPGESTREAVRLHETYPDQDPDLDQVQDSGSDDGYFDGLETSCPVRADLIWA